MCYQHVFLSETVHLSIYTFFPLIRKKRTPRVSSLQIYLAINFASYKPWVLFIISYENNNLSMLLSLHAKRLQTDIESSILFSIFA
jgi:dolichol kinase